MACYGLSLKGLKRDYQNLKSIVAQWQRCKPREHLSEASSSISHLGQIKQCGGFSSRKVLFCFVSEENVGLGVALHPAALIPADRGIEVKTIKVCTTLGVA